MYAMDVLIGKLVEPEPDSATVESILCVTCKYDPFARAPVARAVDRVELRAANMIGHDIFFNSRMFIQRSAALGRQQR